MSRSGDHSDYQGRCQAAGHAPQPRQVRLRETASLDIGYVVKLRKCCLPIKLQWEIILWLYWGMFIELRDFGLEHKGKVELKRRIRRDGCRKSVIRTKHVTLW